MKARVVIALAGVVVASYSLWAAEWGGLAAVVVVLAAIFRWRPSWLRVEADKRELSEAELALRLDELYRWRRTLVPVAFVAVGVQGWALHRLLTTGTSWGVAISMAVVASLLTSLAAVTQVRISRLEGRG